MLSALLFLLMAAAPASAAEKSLTLDADLKGLWNKTVDSAKREGRLVLFLNRGPNWEALLGEFRKEYPEIRVVSVSGSGNQNATRILAERRAGKHSTDIFGGSATSAYNLLHKAGVLGRIKPAFILPEVTDESKWFQGVHRYADPEGQYTFVYAAGPGGLILAYNSRLVNPAEFRSLRDFLDSKWKGKIVAMDPRFSAMVAKFFFYNPKLGPGLLRKLYGDAELIFSRDFRLLTDWLAKGKFALCIGCRDIKKAKAQGLPVDEFDNNVWSEGAALTVSGNTLSLLNQAPHPHAARVFINWFLSKKGQMVYQELSAPDDPPNSLRIDIPKDGIPKQNRLFDHVTYFDLASPEFADMAPVYRLLDEILKGR